VEPEYPVQFDRVRRDAGLGVGGAEDANRSRELECPSPRDGGLQQVTFGSAGRMLAQSDRCSSQKWFLDSRERALNKAQSDRHEPRGCSSSA
jgi:hypothetical protein